MRRQLCRGRQANWSDLVFRELETQAEVMGKLEEKWSLDMNNGSFDDGGEMVVVNTKSMSRSTLPNTLFMGVGDGVHTSRGENGNQMSLQAGLRMGIGGLGMTGGQRG